MPHCTSNSDILLQVKAAWPLRVLPPLFLLALGYGASELLLTNRFGSGEFWLGADLVVVTVAIFVIWAVAINSYSIRANEQAIVVHDYPHTRITQWNAVKFYEFWPAPRDPNSPSGLLILLKDHEKVTVGTIPIWWPISTRSRHQLIDFIAPRATLIPTIEHPAKTRATIVSNLRFNTFVLAIIALTMGYLISPTFSVTTGIVWLFATLRAMRQLRRWDRAHPMKIGGSSSKISPHDKR